MDRVTHPSGWFFRLFAPFMGDEPASARLLDLKICDPAMGSGAFLVEACRYLADQVVAAWTREQRLDKVADEHEDVVNHARRLVAQRCLYGVDKNRFLLDQAPPRSGIRTAPDR